LESSIPFEARMLMRPGSLYRRLSRGMTGVAGLLFSGCGGGESPTQPPVPTHLVFVVQPSSTPSSQAIMPNVQVAIADAAGETVTAATNAVTVALGSNPGGGTLSGTTTVSAIG